MPVIEPVDLKPTTAVLDPRLERRALAPITKLTESELERDAGASLADRTIVIPPRFHLAWLIDGRLEVVRPFEVVTSFEDGCVVLHVEQINEIGYGTTFAEATSDLQHAIAELYFSLLAENDQLGPDLANVWGALQQLVRLKKHP